MVIYDNAIEFVINTGKYYLTILCPDSVIPQINKILRHDRIWVKRTNPTKAIIEMNSKKALIFFADYFENKFFMTFCNYEFRDEDCFFCGKQVTVKFDWDKLKHPIRLCSNCYHNLKGIIK